MRRSLRSREAAQAASIGRPKLSTSIGYILPLLRLALCEIASSSWPTLRWPSIHFQRSSGCLESIEEKGISGTARHSRKKMLRCMFWLSGIDVHSYEQNAVNLPGWLLASAILTLSFQIVPWIWGLMKALIGG